MALEEHMKEERSNYWNRDRTYSVVVRDGIRCPVARTAGLSSVLIQRNAILSKSVVIARRTLLP
jgi:hypothetical protein